MRATMTTRLVPRCLLALPLCVAVGCGSDSPLAPEDDDGPRTTASAADGGEDGSEEGARDGGAGGKDDDAGRGSENDAGGKGDDDAGRDEDAGTDAPGSGIGDGESTGGGGSANGALGLGDSAGDSTSSLGGAPAMGGGATSGGITGSTVGGTGGAVAESPSDSGGDLDGEIGGPEPDPSRPGNGQVEPGVLTAGAWDDNLNFNRFMEYRDEWADEDADGALELTDEEHEAAHEAFAGERDAHQKLDVSLVIDTTGSMTDELSYLQVEFLAISETIHDLYPDAKQRWSLVVYKDEGDEYEVRWFDFREDPMEFREKLAAQSGGGGGDFPEAPDAAFEIMNQLAWRSADDVARLAFWVADAPPHSYNAGAMTKALRTARDQDVHIYPVASSGIDEHTELGMRSAAQLTGGRYLFLTDDSGVGGAHKEPSIPCYFVTKLDDAIVRMVDIEMSGTYREPDEADVIRTGGDPQDGACMLESGQEVAVF